jgi:hypothetical protein
VENTNCRPELTIVDPKPFACRCEERGEEGGELHERDLHLGGQARRRMQQCPKSALSKLANLFVETDSVVVQRFSLFAEFLLWRIAFVAFSDVLVVSMNWSKIVLLGLLGVRHISPPRCEAML